MTIEKYRPFHCGFQPSSSIYVRTVDKSSDELLLNVFAGHLKVCFDIMINDAFTSLPHIYHRETRPVTTYS